MKASSFLISKLTFKAAVIKTVSYSIKTGHELMEKQKSHKSVFVVVFVVDGLKQRAKAINGEGLSLQPRFLGSRYQHAKE